MASSRQQARNRARNQNVGLNALRQERPKLSKSIQNPESFARKLRSKKLLEDSAWKDILEDTCEYSQQLKIIFESVEKCWFNVDNAFDQFLKALQETPPNETLVSQLEQAYESCDYHLEVNLSILTDPPTLDALVAMTQKCPEWHILGMKLDIDTRKLREIKRAHKHDNDAARKEMFSHWLKNQRGDSSWQTIISCLDGLGLNTISDEIKGPYQRGLESEVDRPW